MQNAETVFDDLRDRNNHGIVAGAWRPEATTPGCMFNARLC